MAKSKKKKRAPDNKVRGDQSVRLLQLSVLGFTDMLQKDYLNAAIGHEILTRYHLAREAGQSEDEVDVPGAVGDVLETYEWIKAAIESYGRNFAMAPEPMDNESFQQYVRKYVEGKRH